MDKLIFLATSILSKKKQLELRLPLVFINYALIEGKLYKYKSFPHLNVPLGYNKNRDNRVIYGALYLCKDFDFYSKQLDAFFSCSLSALGSNHRFDLSHRVESDVTLIEFETLDQLSRLMYEEKATIKAEIYTCNTNHPKIKRYISDTRNRTRVKSGVDVIAFKQLFMEVSQWEKQRKT